MSQGSLRNEMPTVTEIIDGFRETFGKAYIDDIIRRGIRGEPVFFASENGHVIGTEVPVGVRVATNADGSHYLLDGPIDGDQEVELTKYEARMRREQNEKRGK